ncbi:MAG: biotin/lipoyl-binding protein [Candidatus Dadabacteria bacterium]|nr:biotin/lipoyl-binding protein [Candidatus Dadabacteria bacterium]
MMYTFKFQGDTYKINLEEEGEKTEVEISASGDSTKPDFSSGKSIPIEFQKIDESFYSIIVDGRSIGVGILKKGKKVEVFLGGDLYEFESISDREREKAKGVISGVQEIKSPMPSRVVKILKSNEDVVKEGEGIIVIEAMKMESELKSPIEGKVKEVKVKEGDAVESGTVLVMISSE